MKQTFQAAAAFTLLEVLVATGIGSTMLGGLVVGSIALQRGYSAAEYQIGCQLDQMRVIDYITRDLRRATAVSTENQNRKLVLTLPDQWDSAAKATRDPEVVNGNVHYSSASIPVAYYVEGDAFIREENGVQKTIATRRIENFLADTSNLPEVEFELAFTPRFSRNAGDEQRTAARISTTVRVRNAIGKVQ